ncbi:hypothetical protein T265_08968 [Opisthorchis viverrini]|uniref:Uncharacterized protein n=1 Tax=Opisthorchis viverrini TaxID=6198 RepID=A0A075A6K1_OPIVI|nr:hypothetical protein T265_08968 [Opisthorchis viverrini]KER23069.1 hypothetical protein T265_08968 [Opisthorchis viverrini]
MLPNWLLVFMLILFYKYPENKYNEKFSEENTSLEENSLNRREYQAGFRSSRSWVNHIFTLRQKLEERHMYRRIASPAFLYFKGVLDFVDRSVL